MFKSLFNPLFPIFCAALFASLPLHSSEVRAKSIHFGPGPGGTNKNVQIHFGPGPGGNGQTVKLHPLALLVMRGSANSAR